VFRKPGQNAISFSDWANFAGKKRGKCWRFWPNVGTIQQQYKFALNLGPDEAFNATEAQVQLNKNADFWTQNPVPARGCGFKSHLR